MAKLDGYSRKEILDRVRSVKEDHRDLNTGVLDTRSMATSALKEWEQDDPDSYAEFVGEATIYTVITEYEKDAQSKRSQANRRLDVAGISLDEEDFDPAAVEAWNIPAPGELNLEYHVPIEGSSMVPERLGDMTVEQVFALADYHGKREESAKKSKLYFRRVGHIALYWKKRKALADEATLWEIFGVNPGQAA